MIHPVRHLAFPRHWPLVACAALFIVSSASSASPRSGEPPAQRDQAAEPAKKGPVAKAPIPATSEPQEKPEAQPARLPGLDELLGMPGASKQGADHEPEINPEQLKLDRALDAASVSELFEQAIEQMADAAKLLKDGRDAGLDTQRVQEEIIRKLEKLIQEAENQQQQSSSSSSSSSSGQKQSQSRRQPSQPQQGPNAGNQGENRGEHTPPAAQTPVLKGQLDALRAAWGALPARLRDALLQGAGDRYSSLYESMTEEYYRRLAEQNRNPQ